MPTYLIGPILHHVSCIHHPAFRKIGHSKGFKFTILTMFLTRVFTPNFSVIEKTLGMAELPASIMMNRVREAYYVNKMDKR
jgi:hypothetical protein